MDSSNDMKIQLCPSLLNGHGGVGLGESLMQSETCCVILIIGVIITADGVVVMGVDVGGDGCGCGGRDDDGGGVVNGSGDIGSSSLNWCMCGVCQVMESAVECSCAA